MARRLSRSGPGSPRTRFAVIATLLALAPVTACGGVRLGDTANEFTVMGYGMGDAMSTVREGMAEQAIGHLDVVVNEGAFDQQQFISAVAADTPPDVVHMDRQLIGGYAARGAVMPLTDCIRDQKIDLGQYHKAAMAGGVLDGTVYSIPDTVDNRPLLINTKMVREAGLKVSDIDTSNWPKLKRAVRKMVRFSDGKLTRIGFDPKIPEFFPMWVKVAGGDIVSKDGRTARLDSPEAIKALEFTSELVNIQGGWGNFRGLYEFFNMFGDDNPLATKQLGALPMEEWYVRALSELSPDLDLEVAPVTGLDGEPVNYISGYGWAIPAGSKHPEEACTFIKEITSERAWTESAKVTAEEKRAEDQLFIGQFTGNVHANENIANRIWKPTGNKNYDKVAKDLASLQRTGFEVPATAAGPEFRNAWLQAVNRVLSGVQTPTQALRQAQREAQSALEIATDGGK